MRVEQFDQLGEVGERPRQPVNLVDDDHVDLAGPDVVQQLLERRPLHRTAREAAVVIAFADELSSLTGLAFNVGLGSLALVVEGVEVLFQGLLRLVTTKRVSGPSAPTSTRAMSRKRMMSARLCVI